MILESPPAGIQPKVDAFMDILNLMCELFFLVCICIILIIIAIANGLERKQTE